MFPEKWEIESDTSLAREQTEVTKMNPSTIQVTKNPWMCCQLSWKNHWYGAGSFNPLLPRWLEGRTMDISPAAKLEMKEGDAIDEAVDDSQ